VSRGGKHGMAKLQLWVSIVEQEETRTDTLYTLFVKNWRGGLWELGVSGPWHSFWMRSEWRLGAWSIDDPKKDFAFLRG